MRLNLLLGTVTATALLAGAALAQDARPSQSSTPTTNDPTTYTDDQCGKNKGPRPCEGDVVAVQPMSEPAPAYEPAADTSTSQMYSPPAVQPEVRTSLITNGPVPDTPENRDRFGGPDSNGGKRTSPSGN